MVVYWRWNDGYTLESDSKDSADTFIYLGPKGIDSAISIEVTISSTNNGESAQIQFSQKKASQVENLDFQDFYRLVRRLFQAFVLLPQYSNWREVKFTLPIPTRASQSREPFEEWGDDVGWKYVGVEQGQILVWQK